MKRKFLFIIILVLILDLVSKALIFSHLELNSKYTIINIFFSIYPIKNYGAAFSFFSNSNLFLISVSVIILIYLCTYIYKQKISFFTLISYYLLIGGLLGNLFDRMVYQYVRDFISFRIFGYDFAIFNIADIAIVVGVIFIIISSIFKENRV